jgi:mannose-6-phosphate isomerase-like protein (cupin superfamily)
MAQQRKPKGDIEVGNKNITQTPWGCYAVLAEHGDFKLKHIVVHPSHRLSLQRHAHRQEHWYILKGQATVEVSEWRKTLDLGDAVDVPAGAWHRLSNQSSTDLEIIEIQKGSYLGEDDIERKQDDYGRVG